MVHMDRQLLQNALKDLGIPGIYYFEETDSTNERALALAVKGAPEFTLIIADRQTAGRGRFGRRWETTPGTSLAFTIILHPTLAEQERMSLFSFLGAVAICLAIEELSDIKTQIKWPNDILLGGRKTCGILAETTWNGSALEGLVLGMGINLLKGSVPPPDQLMFPATCVQAYCANKIDRIEFLKSVINNLIIWRSRTLADEFLKIYRSRLAFSGERVALSKIGGEFIEGLMVGVDDLGNLMLQDDKGKTGLHPIGDLKLRKS